MPWLRVAFDGCDTVFSSHQEFCCVLWVQCTVFAPFFQSWRPQLSQVVTISTLAYGVVACRAAVHEAGAKTVFLLSCFLARVLLCLQPLLVDEHLRATSDGPVCGSEVGRAAALLHVSFVVELVCEERGLGHREMVGAHCLLPSCPQLLCAIISPSRLW